MPSSALRVTVYAGIELVTKRPNRLREIVPPGPKSWVQAEKALRRPAGDAAITATGSHMSSTAQIEPTSAMSAVGSMRARR